MVDETTAEVAFIVREDQQGMGIASYLLGVLEKIARENQYKAFSKCGNDPRFQKEISQPENIQGRGRYRDSHGLR
jgi:GNAT superfamily N-acetyltransferase